MTHERNYLLADIMIGGNHLASSLVNVLGSEFSYRYPPDMDVDMARDGIAQERMRYESLSWVVIFDMWVAWAAIMRARTLSSDGGELVQQRGASDGPHGDHLGAERREITIRPNSFGDVYSYEMPKGCTVVVACTNDGTGLVPRRVLLPHQVYVKTVRELIELHRSEGRYGSKVEVTLIPACNLHYIDLPLPASTLDSPPESPGVNQE